MSSRDEIITDLNDFFEQDVLDRLDNLEDRDFRNQFKDFVDSIMEVVIKEAEENTDEYLNNLELSDEEINELNKEKIYYSLDDLAEEIAKEKLVEKFKHFFTEREKLLAKIQLVFGE